MADTTYRYADEPLTSVVDLVNYLKRDEERTLADLDSAGGGRIPMWFRGQANLDDPLLPTLSTLNFKPDLEHALLDRFKQNAGSIVSPVPDDSDEWAWMFLMRHFRAPSRLLDWTESALIGLYFAVQAGGHDDKDGALWLLLPSVLNELAKIHSDPHPPVDVPRFGSDRPPSINNYLISRVMDGRGSSTPPIAGFGARNSERMTAQQSVFTVFHADLKALEKWHGGQHVWRYPIPSKSKRDLREELRRLGVNRLSIFPELESVAEVARQFLNA